ncbi:molecular chaperone HtpG [Ensifer soli]|uniref:molecular chaperone HtpG n=1 Tax=Ciceribacter sp. sgz301302 TaxID=3342379 RepID=UPI0035B7EB80
MNDETKTADVSASPAPEHHVFEADVARLLHMMVHSVYSDKDVFLRELISNAADACEKLRYEAIGTPGLLGDDAAARITITLDEAEARLTIEDNGIGMDRAELAEALGTIARSGTRAFMERIEAAEKSEGTQLIGQFGVGFYSAFMVADRVDVVSRKAGTDAAFSWSSDGKGSYAIAPADLADAPVRGTRVVLHLKDEAKSYTSKWTVERIVKAQSGHIPVPIALIEKPGAEANEIADGTALWTKPKSEIGEEAYAEFYRNVSGQYDDPALTVHFRAEGRHEYTALAFVPGSQPFDLFDPDRKGRMKLYVRRVFITDDAGLLPRYLRFVRGLVDTADLPLNVSREMIQESPVLSAMRKGLTSRVLTALEKLAESDAEKFRTIWETFGAVLKEGIYEDFERRQQLLGLSRFRTTASGDGWRSLADYVKDMKEGQTAIYYLAGDDLNRLKASPQLEGFRARGVEVLLLADQVDSFWVTMAGDFDGKPLKSVSQGAADLAGIAKTGEDASSQSVTTPTVESFIGFAKTVLGDSVSDVRASDRLTESAVCLVAPEGGPDRALEKLLQGAGRIDGAAKPVLEINPDHALIGAIAEKGKADTAFGEDAVRLLFDQAHILDGGKPDDPRAFAERLSRVFERALGA